MFYPKCTNLLLSCMLSLLLANSGQRMTATASLDEIRIGAIMKDHRLHDALNRAVDKVNADPSVLFGTKLIAIVEMVDSENTFEASRAVCRLLEQRVWAIIGPESPYMTPVIQSIAANHQIPFITISWQFSTSLGTNNTIQSVPLSESTISKWPPSTVAHNFSVHFYPNVDQLSVAYYDLIRYKNWKSFSIIYDSTEDLIKIKDVLQATFNDVVDLVIHSVDLASDQHYQMMGTKPDDALAYRKLMKDLRKQGVENVILSVSMEKMYNILHEASKVGLLSVYNDYVVANLDIHKLNLSSFQPLMTNISGYTMLETSGQQVGHADKSWIGGRPAPTSKQLMWTEEALVIDAVSMLGLALDELINDDSIQRQVRVTAPSSTCRNQAIWRHGPELVDKMRSSERRGGYTGNLRFDTWGARRDFDLDYVVHKNNAFQTAGNWNVRTRLADLAKHGDDFGLEAIKNKTLKVTIALTPPYVMFEERHDELEGNARYKGYCIDLMSLLAAKLGFKYTLKEVSDGQYGKIQNGSWTGMIRELLDWDADLAIVDLTITKERQSAVDFTHPFMTLGIAIMFKKPKVEEAELFSFLMPFSTEVWLGLVSAYVGVSMLMWLISRMSPHEWKNPHPCIDNPDEAELENELHSVGASLWFTIGSLMQQGSDLAPRSPSVRSLASVWYFFTLIVISSYTANFAAFLTLSRMQSPIESAEDLSKQTKINYGCKESGSTQAFFASSNHSTYRRMWNFMESKKHEGVFPTDNKKGIELVKKGNYAFLMESTSIDYIVERDCELTQIGGLLDHKGYGIALRKRSPFRASLSKAIVELNEEGRLQDLKVKWWNIENGCVDEKESSLATSELGIDKVGGVFVVLAVGVVCACTTALLEFIWKSLKVSRTERSSIRGLLWRELVRILSCGPSKRPVAGSAFRSSSQPSMLALAENKTPTKVIYSR